MASASFPNSIATFQYPQGSTPRLGHGAMHTQENLEIVAIENTLGVAVQGTDATVKAKLNRLASNGCPMVWVAGNVSAATSYVVAPFAGTVTGYWCQGGAAPAVPGLVTVTVGSAGAVLLTGTPSSAGSAGTVLTLTNTSGTTAISSGVSMQINLAGSGTAWQQSVTLLISRTA